MLYGSLKWIKHEDNYMFQIDEDAKAWKAIEESLPPKIFKIVEEHWLTFKTRSEWEKLGFPPPADNEEAVSEKKTIKKELSKTEKSEISLEESTSEEDTIEVHTFSNPTVKSKRPPQYTPDGAFAWPVSMDIAEAQSVDSWIVQEVTIDSSDTDIHFWEAFPVLAGKTKALFDDIYQDNLRKKSCSAKVKGDMQAYRTDNGDPPPGLKRGTVKEADESQPTSYSKPSWWKGGSGTPHNLAFRLTGGTLDKESHTIPDGSKWEVKAHHWELDRG